MLVILTFINSSKLLTLSVPDLIASLPDLTFASPPAERKGPVAETGHHAPGSRAASASAAAATTPPPGAKTSGASSASAKTPGRLADHAQGWQSVIDCACLFSFHLATHKMHM